MTLTPAPLHSPSRKQAGSLPFALALTLVCLNLFDTGATLHLVAKGAQEANPLLAVLLVFPLLFVLAKTVLVALLALVLLLAKARRALWGVVLAYVSVCVVHVWLFGLTITR